MKTMLLRAAALLLACMGIVSAKSSDYLSYDDFIRAAQAGQIKSVTLDRFSSISGTQVLDGVESPFHSYAQTGTANDPLLLRFLQEKSVGVTVSGKTEREPWCPQMLLPLLMFGIPLITLVLVVLIYRRIRRLQPPQSHQSDEPNVDTRLRRLT